ncbi:5'-AMP-activated protein kinase, beta subunit [Phytophthora megakarya]|uniref:5'-AMP-activated protein kinase, beta subunit n=1 Tax=Phytophthora megakarya TaxID=4795 RepID=A0A225VCC4_9STRA|nr:5'-AMP-activated protein kinase, beta subunit [Phytophthora megakarya]
MGSASSKAGDANPKNLGADPNDPNAFPLHHHPYYNQAGHGQTGSDGKFSDQQYSEAMEVDPPTETSSDVSYADGEAQMDGKDADHAKGNNAQTTDVTLPPGEDVVPMVFKWEHGGRNVFITGTFNGWDKQCPMHRSGNDFTYIANLTRGKHMYKFVVDDDWRFAPDQLTMADVEGNVNNYVDVSEFAPLSDFDGKRLQDDDEDPENPYARYIPEIDEYTKEPPPLPPHLRHIILNKALAAHYLEQVDGRLLPVPQHVALNHLYCTAIKDGMMVLGITNRYKQKFVTTVYYSLMPGAN